MKVKAQFSEILTAYNLFLNLSCFNLRVWKYVLSRFTRWLSYIIICRIPYSSAFPSSTFR